VIAFVTGASGSVGKALVERLRARGDGVVGSDIKTGTDVLRFAVLNREVKRVKPDVIYHLAGAKHAPHGEVDPWRTTLTNVWGTRNVLDVAPERCRVVLASTCKAADPETVYGATKLIAERMVLNEGHSVARFYNVREASGNVFELWRSMLPDGPLPASACERYFITMAQAVNLLLTIPDLRPGRYTINPGQRHAMTRVAESLVGGKNVTLMPPRRGDRLREPRIAEGESLEQIGGEQEGALERILNQHDVVPA
jgi:FlaA1/EpsC-like NDP-sugar epimerase